LDFSSGYLRKPIENIPDEYVDVQTIRVDGVPPTTIDSE
jgi:hypothetical protein